MKQLYLRKSSSTARDCEENLDAEDFALVARLYADHSENLLRFCFRLCGDADGAQDLLMETIHAAPGAVKRFSRRSSVKTWLYRIALNKWREGRRTLQRRQELDRAHAPKQPSRDRDLVIAIESELANLSEPLLEAFTLVKMEGLKYREAAKILDVPIGTVQSRVHSACEQMRERLQEVL
ncbi:MAG: RNA polymerase sigma factor [Armatimonadetes bacterium]|nr:RNA polymerase sigma factor [Armatimonadota bacterium]